MDIPRILNDSLKIVISQDKEIIFLGISRDIIATIIITLLIFILGFLIKYWIDKRRENQRLRILEKFILFQMQELAKDLDKIVEGLRMFLDIVKEEKQQNYAVATFNSSHIESFLEISKADIYKIFIFGYKGDVNSRHEHFDNMYKSVRNCKLFDSKFPEDFNKFMVYLNKYYEDWNQNIDEIRKLFENFVTLNKMNNIKPHEDPFLSTFDDIMYSSLQEKNARDMFIAINKFIDPLKKLCNEFRDDPRILPTSNATVGCTTACNNVKNLRLLYINLFEKYKEGYEKSKRDLKNSLDYFNNLKKKTIPL